MTSNAAITETPPNPEPATEAGFPTLQVPDLLEERVGFLLAHTKLVLHAAAMRALVPHGLEESATECSPRHVTCLQLIAQRGPMSQQALGEAIMVDRTTIVSVVDWLEKNGFVVRQRNPLDRRAYALQITDEGRAWMKEAQAEVRAVEKEFLSPLSAAERKQLTELLRRLLTRG